MNELKMIENNLEYRKLLDVEECREGMKLETDILIETRD